VPAGLSAAVGPEIEEHTVIHRRFQAGRLFWAGSCGFLLAAAGLGWAGDNDDLRRLVEQQAKQLEAQARQIEELRRMIESRGLTPAAAAEAADPAKPALSDAAVKKLIGEYLKDNPGAGMPPSVQTGFERGKGFVIRSAPNPSYVKWQDECRIPFELRVRGRIQLDYYFYKSTDAINHLTGQPATQNANAVRLADFSALEIKRGNLILEGSVFDPDLHYRINFNGFTRGIPALQNNEVVQTLPAGAITPNTAPVSPIGGGATVDHGVNLFECYVYYDFRPCWFDKGCGEECPPDCPKYAPTFTLIGGKFKPFFGLDEYLGNQNSQFVEFSMTSLFFSADDDTRMMGAGLQVKALEDRFFLQALMTDGAAGSFVPASHLDKYPGFLAGWWYDFGGSWDADKKAWQLFGDCICDIDYSCCPVVRVGGCVNLTPMDRRSLYGDGEQARFFTMPAGPGGTRLINLLNGDLALPPGAHAVDKFDAYTYTAFAAGKYRGFSLHNEWWFRHLNNFRTTPNGLGNIIYQSTLGPPGPARNALFPANQGLFDYGMELSAGYFLIPKHLEIAARWAWVRGQSGDINGNGTRKFTIVPGLTTPVQVVDGAFRNYHEANEYTIGLNYYFQRHLLKWQTDLGWYDGGNPAAGGTSIAGYIPGVDGYLFRTQVQLAF
jgi:hypothetical protein